MDVKLQDQIFVSDILTGGNFRDLKRKKSSKPDFLQCSYCSFFFKIGNLTFRLSVSHTVLEITYRFWNGLSVNSFFLVQLLENNHAALWLTELL